MDFATTASHNERHVRYYGIRRVNPYLGVIQVIDTGKVRIFSNDGKSWRPRRITDSERFWSPHDRTPSTLPELSKECIAQVIQDHPALPFPLEDRYELWLLSKTTQLPLALLQTRVHEYEISEVDQATWQPFSPGHKTFHLKNLPITRMTRGLNHQELVEQIVNSAARPQPAAQWFLRSTDGSGIGHGGLRIDSKMSGRTLAAKDFPELIVDEQWQREEETLLIRGFHNYMAAQLLAHQHLSRDTRSRLEAAAMARPQPLLDNYRLIPEVLDPRAMRSMLVAARIMRSV